MSGGHPGRRETTLPRMGTGKPPCRAMASVVLARAKRWCEQLSVSLGSLRPPARTKRWWPVIPARGRAAPPPLPAAPLLRLGGMAPAWVDPAPADRLSPPPGACRDPCRPCHNGWVQTSGPEPRSGNRDVRKEAQHRWVRRLRRFRKALVPHRPKAFRDSLNRWLLMGLLIGLLSGVGAIIFFFCPY